MRHPTVLRLAAVSCLALCLAACASGPPRRVSTPAASIQQLTVRVDGSWSVDLRIENFSSVPMRFDGVSIGMTLGGETAGTLHGQPRLEIGPESADITTLALTPTPAARIAVADALASGRSIAYSLSGTLDAAAGTGNARAYPLTKSSSLTPAPGLPGVLR